MIIDKILKGITEEEQKRERTSPLRMSSAGHCGRQIAYQLHGYEAEPLSSRAVMVFRLGDTIEDELKQLILKYVISDDLYITYPEHALEVKVGSQTILGHVDGIVEKPERMILEIKSTNGLRFKMIQRTGIPEGYEAQATAYMHASGIHKTLFIFYNKDTSHLHEVVFEYNPKAWEAIEKRFLSVIESTKENLPDREYGPDDKGKLSWVCSYCSYNKHCWPNAVLQFDKNNKPQLIIKGD